jgi:ADP-ribose pyrophosphatase YjhB (NUDIX family)
MEDWTGAPLSRPPEAILPSVCAVALDDEGRVLLHRRSDNGLWGLPGGKVDPGESVSAAVVREVREETGYEVATVRLTGVYSDPAVRVVATYPDGRSVHYVNLCFLCRVVGGEAAVSGEGLEVGFFEPDRLPEPFLLGHRVRLEDALALRVEPFVR